jgi:hypothetical protein
MLETIIENLMKMTEKQLNHFEEEWWALILFSTKVN